jgi:hypothetical protein
MESQASAITDAASGAKGITRPSLERNAHRFLSDVIVALGFADRETVDQALDEERRKGKRMGRFLVECGALTEQQLGMAIAERYELDYLDLNVFDVDAGAANLITREAAQRYETVPVGFRDVDTLLVAIADPTDGFALNDIAVMTRLEVQPAVAARSDILALIERLPRSTRSAVVVEMPGAAAPEPLVDAVAGAPESEADREAGELRERLAKAEADLARVRESLEKVKLDAARERNEWVVSRQRLEEELRLAKHELESARARRS